MADGKDAGNNDNDNPLDESSTPDASALRVSQAALDAEVRFTTSSL